MPVLAAEAPLPAPSRSPLHTLYADHHRWLHGWLRRKLGCPQDAADVAHDTFVRILASRDALVAMREPRAYLTTTAQRLIIDQARRARIEQAYLAELAVSLDDHAHHPSPEHTTAAVQALAQIGLALEAVPRKARDAFLLHYLDDLPQADVAERLGVSTRMVRHYLVQALTHCQLAIDATL